MSGWSLVVFGISVFLGGMFAPAILRRAIEWLYCVRCKTKFSLCLDCFLHNKCPRYGRHYKEMMERNRESCNGS